MIKEKQQTCIKKVADNSDSLYVFFLDKRVFCKYYCYIRVCIKYSHKNHPDFYSRIKQKSKQTIPFIIQQYKSAVTKLINPKTIFFSWQPRFYDEIIHDEKRLIQIKYYIKNNPKNPDIYKE